MLAGCILKTFAPGEKAMLLLMSSSCVAELICSASLLMYGLDQRTLPQGALQASPKLKRVHAAAGQAPDSPVASPKPCPMAMTESLGTYC